MWRKENVRNRVCGCSCNVAALLRTLDSLHNIPKLRLESPAKKNLINLQSSNALKPISSLKPASVISLCLRLNMQMRRASAKTLKVRNCHYGKTEIKRCTGMFDFNMLFVVGLGVFALTFAFIEYSLSNKKRTKAKAR